MKHPALASAPLVLDDPYSGQTPPGCWRADIAPPADEDLWVFAYGSLIWKPGFDYAECRSGVLGGYHRRFCIVSTIYRGTPANPGLVLGLDRGGCCRGVAYRIARDRREDTLDYLWSREMVNRTYRPRLTTIRMCADGRPVTACVFIADPASDQYCRAQSDDDTARRILGAAGVCGTNLEYLVSTVEHLDKLGLPDAGLTRLLKTVRRLFDGGVPAHP
jgi:glutathione-specific gamma-glutamylcyclotransferase